MKKQSNNNIARKKAKELRCLNIVLKTVPLLHDFYLMNYIGTERPDFILTNSKEEKIGVEHFLVDVLTDKQNAKSRLIEAEKEKIYAKRHLYKNHPKNMEKDIMHCATNILDGVKKFSYWEFICEFERIVDSHKKNIEAYKAAHKFDKFGFICEITVPMADYNWVVSDSKNSCFRQIIRGIPMTYKMWNKIYALLENGDIDFFIITTIPVDDDKKVYSQCYTINTKRPKLYWNFRFFYRTPN